MDTDDAPRPLFDTGLKIRKEVLGTAYVERAIANADDFSRPLQEMVTEYCWGNIWGRPGLDRRTRSLLNIAMLSALNRPHELKLHLRGALTNGATREEIRETILQIGVYCGVPVAIETSRLAQEVFRELDAPAAE
ncbi:carboxymuconolactone decarboxylase family protein [Azorhizobium doebereinerae]|uniref:carboxymuconolactone decarboxylase family protein n=1 Tax=Azorhizobium doebereinerae TaxID=281091 RepID=UPI00040F3BD1|nr:carboxymuconolactone decarboxylase family protein [Azorhizobium doebereinerae]